MTQSRHVLALNTENWRHAQLRTEDKGTRATSARQYRGGHHEYKYPTAACCCTRPCVVVRGGRCGAKSLCKRAQARDVPSTDAPHRQTLRRCREGNRRG